MERSKPVSTQEKERLQKEALEKKALEEAGADDDEQRHASGWYQYFKTDCVKLLGKGIVIHPTPLLSVADHYNRSAAGTSRRVVGCLLGEVHEHVEITNSFGIPFEEQPRDPSVWYLDVSYLKKMYKMFRKINSSEQIVGWYSSGDSLHPNDIDIHEDFRSDLCPHPVFMLVDTKGETVKTIPIQTYYSFEQPSSVPELRRSFVHTNFSLGASEAEDVGVEHLLRDVHDQHLSTLTAMVQDRVFALGVAGKKLQDISTYLLDVSEGRIRENAHILAQLQILMNCLPDKSNPEILSNAFQDFTNDSLFATYIGFASRLVMMLHELVRNKKTVGMPADAVEA